MVKAALHELGLPAGPVRPPLVDATPEQVAQLRDRPRRRRHRAVSDAR